METQQDHGMGLACWGSFVTPFLRGCLETLSLGLAIEHDAGHGDVNPSLVGAGEALVAFAEAAGVVEPTEGALNHPAAGQ